MYFIWPNKSRKSCTSFLTPCVDELICLANMENINAVLIDEGVPQGDRLVRLNQIAINQMRVLENDDNRNLLK